MNRSPGELDARFWPDCVAHAWNRIRRLGRDLPKPQHRPDRAMRGELRRRDARRGKNCRGCRSRGKGQTHRPMRRGPLWKGRGHSGRAAPGDDHASSPTGAGLYSAVMRDRGVSIA